MLLAVDNGNTNVKFALVDDAGEIVQRWRIATDARRTADEYAVWLDQLLQMEGHKRSEIDAVIIATVVPRALHNLPGDGDARPRRAGLARREGARIRAVRWRAKAAARRRVPRTGDCAAPCRTSSRR